MTDFLRPEQVERIRQQHPAGTRICCDNMSDDPHPIEPGTLGEVIGVDDAGQVMTKWDNGRSLSLIPGVDSFHTVELSEELVDEPEEAEGQNMGM